MERSLILFSIYFIERTGLAWLPASPGKTTMVRKPNYSFERKERDRRKAEKKTKRAAAKKAARETEAGAESDAEITNSPLTE